MASRLPAANTNERSPFVEEHSLRRGRHQYSATQFLHSDFLEEDDVVIAVVLKAYVSFIRA